MFGGAVRPYTSCPPVGPLIVQPMGDSTTEGLVPDGGYRGPLLARIAAKLGGAVGPGGAVDSQGSLNNTLYGFDASVCGTAHSGHHGSSAAQWISNGWMAAFNPGTVHMGLLMLGANDVADSALTASLYIGPLADQFLALHPFAVLFVASRHPRASTSGAAFAAGVQSEVEARRAVGNNIVYVDQYTSVDLSESYDGLHYSGAASDKIAARWFEAMDPYLVRP